MISTDEPCQHRAAEGNHHRDDVWIAGGCRFPAGTVYWLYRTGNWSGGFVRSIDRAVSAVRENRVPVLGVERIHHGRTFHR